MSWIAFLVLIFVLWIIIWSYAVFVLDGPSHRQYDKEVGDLFESHPDDLAAQAKFLTSIQEIRKKAAGTKSFKKGFAISREFADNLSADLETTTTFIAVQTNNIDAEWAIAPNVDTRRRILFVHGGAFIIGSAKGHRKFSDRLSRICNGAVLSVNYRLLPENSRMDGVIDAQNAYKWLLKNGPESQEDCDFLLVAGDSAGGNLAFMLSSWSKTNNYRRPDGVIGFSPSLDSTASSPSLKKNRKTDEILGPSLGKLSLLPRSLILWISFLMGRTNPSKLVVSPLLYDLTDLPPTLIQASGNEMLLGESQRYTNKAREAGSDVTLQIWQDQLHDWHLFNMGIGSAEAAWSEVEKFTQRL